MQVINRILKANGFKPRSLELKETAETEVKKLTHAIERLARESNASNASEFSGSDKVNEKEYNNQTILTNWR